MATIRSSAPHEQRTAAEPRENQVEPVILANIREVNDSIRLLRLNAADPSHTIRFRPGQWVDTFLPGLRQAGGFTITSTPGEARPTSHSPPFIELAIQKSKNPPAQWLWRPSEEILGTQLAVRVGGSFTWPPQGLDTQKIERLVLIAGGVGINPLISIFSHLIRIPTHMRPPEIHFLYATKTNYELDPQQILFLPRLMDLTAAAADPNVTLSCFLTGIGDEGVIEHGKLPNRTFGRRFTEEDLVKALDGYKTNVFGPEHDRAGTVAYVCGPPKMTDQVVELLRGQSGMSEERVLCEKWW
ncbi:Putative ferric reductase, NAD binding domain, FAD-binding domain, ferredoxin reductase-type [Septoria linicola]|uniref:Ferric reductase, NAD binding domain, FAD-binding domain, ferredoxin reductase-type n=1 Tax=Septoria linicola TaxID=215465 RepID=A0A9Q9EG92_9PEZI|nr:Putative ferric reductase, NAD binding domain, FAD-binding domain, ferredoxin reductase-type [Septoria linicola]